MKYEAKLFPSEYEGNWGVLIVFDETCYYLLEPERDVPIVKIFDTENEAWDYIKEYVENKKWNLKEFSSTYLVRNKERED